jgi:hypothetical protein
LLSGMESLADEVLLIVYDKSNIYAFMFQRSVKCSLLTSVSKSEGVKAEGKSEKEKATYRSSNRRSPSPPGKVQNL